jgi:YggT family protein
MSALIFILDSLLTLAVFIFLARLLLQWVRADFRNPIAQAVVRLTNPLILPLRRVLPPIGKVDTASVVAVVLVASIKVAILAALTIYGSPGPEQWIRYVALELVSALLSTYLYAVILYALLSLIAPGGYSPLQSVLASVCEPVLRPFRRLIPPIAGIDFSPLWVILISKALLLWLPSLPW